MCGAAGDAADPWWPSLGGVLIDDRMVQGTLVRDELPPPLA
jgi:hypothetical protein